MAESHSLQLHDRGCRRWNRSTSGAANLMVKRHKIFAPQECRRRADQLAASGDIDGEAVWKPPSAARPKACFMTVRRLTFRAKGNRLRMHWVAFSVAVAIAGIMLNSGRALAWGPEGHALIGKIADQLLAGTVAGKRVDAILGTYTPSVVTLTLVLLWRLFRGLGLRTWSRRRVWGRHCACRGIA